VPNEHPEGDKGKTPRSLAIIFSIDFLNIPTEAGRKKQKLWSSILWCSPEIRETFHP